MSGIFGVASKTDCMKHLFYGTDYLSHLGTQYGGIAVQTRSGMVRKIRDISTSQFKSKFEDEYDSLEGKLGIGVISASDTQPVFIHSKWGPFALVMDGLVHNAESLMQEMLGDRYTFSEETHGGVNQVELVAKLISHGEDIVSGIDHMYSKIEGSCSLLLLHDDGIYAARAPDGHTAMVLGEQDGIYSVSSESCSFPNLGIKTKKYLMPGEVIKINDSGIVQIKDGDPQCNKICAFLWVYTGFPASTFEGISTEVVRENCGKALARRDTVEADMAAGVPDSGLGHGIGYSHESGLPYRRPLVKYTAGYGRSYTPPTQDKRDLIAQMKLIPIEEVIKGNRIVLMEDSIVRGTQLKNFTVIKLWESGAKEVHVRPACPPLMFPCRYNLSTRTESELVARRAIKDIEGERPDDISEYLDPDSEKYKLMVDWIARDLGVTTLQYQRLDDLVEAIGMPKDKLCLHCWSGE